MGVVDAPQWLLPAFVRSVRVLGSTATAEQVQQAGERLIEMWASPDRCFHNLTHAIDMLARVDELADESHNPDVMRLAAWYHGCVFSSATEQIYRRNGGEDEEASAAYARRDLTALGVPERVTERVCALIINLKRRNLEPSDIDALALNDADLGTLAADPQAYKRYRELVRQEYAHIPEGDYLRARLEIVSRLLARDNLFCSPLGQRWEAAARQNLEAERKRLEDGLAALPQEVALPVGGGDGHEVVQPGSDDAPAGPATAASLPSASTAASADDALTPAGGLARVSPLPAARTGASAPRRLEPARPQEAPEVSRVMEHATSMESCIEDLDAILCSRPQGQDVPLDRQAQAESERLKMAERLRLKAEEAKCLREARTGEIAPVIEQIIDDGASAL
ncbi:HD domain-containing protein [Actinomyces sp. W5033]|uniref:HD domain-containing protein n=1 Tax=Actinomyces sp. W5033 TaxID=3446479 RepID=UPI003EDFD640